jgi:phosphoglycolate phosphatase-like HAD superfamily hydrolase
MAESPRVVNILFDLDGTLTDPREGIVACFQTRAGGFRTQLSFRFRTRAIHRAAATRELRCASGLCRFGADKYGC